MHQLAISHVNVSGGCSGNDSTVWKIEGRMQYIHFKRPTSSCYYPPLIDTHPWLTVPTLPPWSKQHYTRGHMFLCVLVMHSSSSAIPFEYVHLGAVMGVDTACNIRCPIVQTPSARTSHQPPHHSKPTFCFMLSPLNVQILQM